MSVTSFPVASNLYLVLAPNARSMPVSAPKRTNHVFVIDCSGSMWGELEKVRNHIKNKLATLLNPGDTFSCVWFSGRGQFGTLIEAAQINSPADMEPVKKAVDKWLKPMGLTGFKEPIEEVARLATRVKNGNPFAMHFLSDGGENCWPRDQVLKAVEETGAKIASCTIVEYGYYADRAFLARMAEKTGGAHVFAQDFEQFEPVFNRVITAGTGSTTRCDVKVEGDAIGGFVFARDRKGDAGSVGELVTYAIEKGVASVPEHIPFVFYLSPTPVGVVDGATSAVSQAVRDNAAYAAISLFAMRGKPEIVWPLLKMTADVRFINQFANCFGKQKYSDFQKATDEASAYPEKRGLDGYNPNLVPRENAFTVMHVLRLLDQDAAARLLLDSKDFRYARIGRAREANDGTLKFEADWAMGGYPVNGLVFNETRPNVSVRVIKKGHVKLPLNRPAGLPAEFPTHVFRNYTIIKDGLVNVAKLPVLVSKDTFDRLAAEDAIVTNANKIDMSMTIDGTPVVACVIDLEKLPVINRQMVNSLTKEVFFQNQLAIVEAQAEAKVYGAYLSDLFTKAAGTTRTSEALEEKYGAEAARWLKEEGITSNGFNPKSTTAEPSGDFYVAKELHVSLKGLSSLPTLKDAKEKLAKYEEEKKAKGNKAKPPVISARLMKPTIDVVEAMIAKNRPDTTLKGWLDVEQQSARDRVRARQRLAAQHVSTLIIGQVWFSDAASLDDNTANVTVKDEAGEVTIACTAEMKEVEVKL